MIINNLKIKDKSLLIWDIENISVSYFKQFYTLLGYIPQKLYAVSKVNIGIKNKKFLEENNITYINSKSIADDRIINILEISKLNNSEFTIVSSDNDFSKIANILIQEGKKVNWFFADSNKKRILMKNDITSSINFKILKKLPNRNGLRILKKSRECNKKFLEEHPEPIEDKYGKLSASTLLDGKLNDAGNDKKAEINIIINSNNKNKIPEVKSEDRFTDNTLVIGENKHGILIRGNYKDKQKILEKNSLISTLKKKDYKLYYASYGFHYSIKESIFISKEEYQEESMLKFKNLRNKKGICHCCKENKNIRNIKTKDENSKIELCIDCETLFIYEEYFKNRISHKNIKLDRVKELEDFIKRGNEHKLDFLTYEEMQKNLEKHNIYKDITFFDLEFRYLDLLSNNKRIYDSNHKLKDVSNILLTEKYEILDIEAYNT